MYVYMSMHANMCAQQGPLNYNHYLISNIALRTKRKLSALGCKYQCTHLMYPMTKNKHVYRGYGYFSSYISRLCMEWSTIFSTTLFLSSLILNLAGENSTEAEDWLMIWEVISYQVLYCVIMGFQLNVLMLIG